MMQQKNQTQSKKIAKNSNNVVINLKNFANKIFQLQAILESQYSLTTVQQLSRLYKIGMQYYLMKQPKKTAYLKKKLISLLGDEQCLQILQNQNKRKRKMQLESIKNNNNKRQNPETQRTNCSQSSEFNQLDLIRINIISSVTDNGCLRKQINSQLKSEMESADNQLKNLIQSSEKIAIRSSELKQKQFQKQQIELQERLQVKKMKKDRRGSNIDLSTVSEKQI